MTYYVGIDVSLETSSICVVDQAGSLVREFKVVSDPEALAAGRFEEASPSACGGRGVTAPA